MKLLTFSPVFFFLIVINLILAYLKILSSPYRANEKKKKEPKRQFEYEKRKRARKDEITLF